MLRNQAIYALVLALSLATPTLCFGQSGTSSADSASSPAASDQSQSSTDQSAQGSQAGHRSVGRLELSVGLSTASVQQTTVNSDGSSNTSNSGTVIGEEFQADYLYSPSSGKLAFGPSVLHWSLPGSSGISSTSDTSVGLDLTYDTSQSGSVHLVIGKDTFLGYDQMLTHRRSGLFVTADIVAASKGATNSFADFGVGYRL